MFNRRESRAVLAGVVVLASLQVALLQWRRWSEPAQVSYQVLEAEWIPFEPSKPAWKSKPKRQSTYKPYPKAKEKAMILPAFGTHPDSLKQSDWEALGLSPKQAQLASKLSKHQGGIKDQADLERIFVLNPSQREALASRLYFSGRSVDSSRIARPKFTPVALNGSDSLALLQVPGLGKFTVMLIMAHRRHYGGFVSLGELATLPAMQEARYQMLQQRLYCDSVALKPISWRYMGKTQLKGLSFLSWKHIDGLLALRNKQPQKLPTIQQLKEIGLTDSSALWFQRYLGSSP